MELMPSKLKSSRTLADNFEIYRYVNSTSVARYFVEQIIFLFCSWIPTILGIILRAVAYKLVLNSKGLQVIEEGVSFKRPKDIHLDKGVYIGRNAYLWGTPNGLFIGANTRVMHNAWINVNNYSKFTVHNITLDAKYESKIEIGEYCIIGAFSCLLGYGHLRIGNYVTISDHCSIMAYNHIFSDKNMRIMDQGVEKQQIIIEDDVWIGSNSVVLPGVRIGQGSVIGAGSVVSKDIEPYSITAGNPARVVKER
jgi:acetyltransferase-like isoleucine patch superfamily enzyme